MNSILYNILTFIYKNFLWVLLLGFLLFLFAYMSSVIRNQDSQRDFEIQTYKKEIDLLNRIVSQTKNNKGEEKTKVKAIVGDKGNLKEIQEVAKMLKDLKIEMKDLRSVTSFNVTSSGQFVTLTKDSIVEKINYRGDSLKADTIQQKITLINYKEPAGWFEMKGTIEGDTMKFNPVFYNEYNVAIHEEKKPKRYWLDIFRAKQTIGTIQSKNPYSHTNQATVIVQEKKKKGLFSRLFF